MPNEINSTTTVRITIGQALYLTTLLIVLIGGWMDLRYQVKALSGQLSSLTDRVSKIEHPVKGQHGR